MKLNKSKLREALIVSPVSQTSNSSIKENEYFGDDSSFYNDKFHYEVDFSNTGFIDEGVLYMDPTVDGTDLKINLVDEDGYALKSVTLDLNTLF